MIVKLLLSFQLIDETERVDTLDQFNEAFQKTENSTNPIVQKLNSIMSHPFGVLASLYGYVMLRGKLQELENKKMADQQTDLFAQQLEAKVMQKILDNNL